MEYFLGATLLIIILVAIRMIVRRRLFGTYVEVFQTNSRSMTLPESMTRQLQEENIRYRIVYKGPPNQPVIGMAGEQFISLEVHVEDLARAKRVVSSALNESWRRKR